MPSGRGGIGNGNVKLTADEQKLRAEEKNSQRKEAEFVSWYLKALMQLVKAEMRLGGLA